MACAEPMAGAGLSPTSGERTRAPAAGGAAGRRRALTPWLATKPLLRLMPWLAPVPRRAGLLAPTRVVGTRLRRSCAPSRIPAGGIFDTMAVAHLPAPGLAGRSAARPPPRRSPRRTTPSSSPRAASSSAKTAPRGARSCRRLGPRAAREAQSSRARARARALDRARAWWHGVEDRWREVTWAMRVVRPFVGRGEEG